MSSKMTEELTKLYAEATASVTENPKTLGAFIMQAYQLGLSASSAMAKDMDEILRSYSITFPTISFSKSPEYANSLLSTSDVRYADIIVSSVNDQFTTPENFIFERVGVVSRNHTPVVSIEMIDGLLLREVYVAYRFMRDGGITDWTYLTINSDDQAWSMEEQLTQ